MPNHAIFQQNSSKNLQNQENNFRYRGAEFCPCGGNQVFVNCGGLHVFSIKYPKLKTKVNRKSQICHIPIEHKNIFINSVHTRIKAPSEIFFKRLD